MNSCKLNCANKTIKIGFKNWCKKNYDKDIKLLNQILNRGKKP